MLPIFFCDVKQPFGQLFGKTENSDFFSKKIRFSKINTYSFLFANILDPKIHFHDLKRQLRLNFEMSSLNYYQLL